MNYDDLDFPEFQGFSEFGPLDFDQGTVSAEPGVSYSAEEAVLKQILDQLAGLQSLQQEYRTPADGEPSWDIPAWDSTSSPTEPPVDPWQDLLDGRPASDDDPLWG